MQTPKVKNTQLAIQQSSKVYSSEVLDLSGSKSPRHDAVYPAAEWVYTEQ